MDEPTLDLPPAGFDAVLRRMIALRESEAEELRTALRLRDERVEFLDAKCHELAAIIERLDRWVTERDRRIEALEATIATRDDGIAGKDANIPTGGISPDSAILRHLVLTLEWPNGPRALRAVLPLARLIRRIMRR